MYADRNTTSGNEMERTPIHLAVLSVIKDQRKSFSMVLHRTVSFSSEGVGNCLTISIVKWS